MKPKPNNCPACGTPVKDGEFELVFPEDRYLCKILGGKDAN